MWFYIILGNDLLVNTVKGQVIWATFSFNLLCHNVTIESCDCLFPVLPDLHMQQISGCKKQYVSTPFQVFDIASQTTKNSWSNPTENFTKFFDNF